MHLIKANQIKPSTFGHKHQITDAANANIKEITSIYTVV
ncbi:hypothetical protein AOR13_2089 [Alteromonas stellipolaris LMG 21856]|nr:hypothetical protein AOR13_2089 [Alteromonas stellipolaris LMG 21856]